MSNYRTHTYFNLFILLPISLIAIYYFFKPAQEILYYYAGAYVYATCFMTPDADVADKIKLFSLRGLMTLPFRPYSKIFSHRGISHWVLIGTLSRVLWLALLAFIFYQFIYQHTFSFDPLIKFYAKHKMPVIYAAAGLFISDLGHLLLDRKA